MSEVERRVFESKLELRAGEGEKQTLVGYAAMFNSLSRDLGGFRETIHPEAFTRSLAAGGNVVARAEHDSRLLLGTTEAGTLRLSVDERGLRYEVDVPDTQAGRDTMTLVRRGDLKRSSFAFMVEKDGDDWQETPEGTRRELRAVELVDVAPVAIPAYEATMVSARALERATAKPAPPVGVPNEVNQTRRALAEKK